MALIEFVCLKCGFKTEEIVKADGVYPPCPKCGGQLKQVFSGKCYISSAKGSSCGGNCAGCSGCKH